MKTITIDSKYKISFHGEYHPGITDCCHCNYKLMMEYKGQWYDHVIGFCDSSMGLVTVIECPKCFEKWCFHTRYLEVGYYRFLRTLEAGTNKHFKGVSVKR